MRKGLFFVRCIAAAATVTLLSAGSHAQQKSARACEAEWKANKATLQGTGKKRKDFIAECRSGTGQTATAPSTTPAPDANAPRGTASATDTTTAKRPRRGTTVSTGAAQFASESEAKAHCPGQTVVWANTRSKVYHFPGSRTYGNTRRGAYMCERDTAAAGLRSAKNEKRPQ
jgi:hypothetical protein